MGEEINEGRKVRVVRGGLEEEKREKGQGKGQVRGRRVK